MKTIFTTGQIAKICKVAPRTVSKWFDSGRLRGYRIPGSQDRRIPRENLIRFLKEHGMPYDEFAKEEAIHIFCFAAEKRFNEKDFTADFPVELHYEQNPLEAVAVIIRMRPLCVVVDYSLREKDVSDIVRFLLAHKDNYSILIGVGSADTPHDGIDIFISDRIFFAADVERAINSRGEKIFDSP